VGVRGAADSSGAGARPGQHRRRGSRIEHRARGAPQVAHVRALQGSDDRGGRWAGRGGTALPRYS